MANFLSPQNDDLASLCSSTSFDNIKDKYDKLVQEYSKLKNKFVVLKKAYLELNETTTQKDQLIRKNEQEVESLTFRNQQLASRITILQSELSKNQTSITNDKPNIDVQVMMEELNNKINENMTLHKRLNELELQLQNNSTSNLTYETNKPQLIIQEHVDLIAKNKLIEKLENDKIKLELKIIKLENEMNELKESNALSFRNNSVFKNSNENSNFMFDEKKLTNFTKEKVSSLVKIYSCVEDKLISINPSFFKDKQNNLMEEDQIPSRVETLNEFNLLFESIANNHLIVFEKFLLLQQQEQSSNDDLNQTTQKISHKIENLVSLIQNFKQIDRNVFKIFFDNNKEMSESLNLNQLVDKFDTIIQNLNEIVKLFDEKLYIEHELGTSQILLTMDECIIFYLKDYVSKFKEWADYLNRFCENFIKKTTFPELFNENSLQNTQMTERIRFLEESERELTVKLEEAISKITELESNKLQNNGNFNEEDFKDQQFFENQINELKYQLYLAESKLICVYQELHSVWRNLNMSNDDTLKYKQKTDELNEELDVTRKRYEDQLRTMSDHIASMNETLTQQAEKIDNFNNQTANKTSKKK